MDDSNWLTFGPLTTFDIGVLREILDKNGAQYKVEASQEGIADYHASIKERPIQPYPMFEPAPGMLMLKLPLRHVLLVRGELEKMGHPVHSTPPQAPGSPAEYLCPKCEYLSPTEGLCPRHKVKLLEYSAWVAQRSKRIQPVWIWLTVAAFLTMLLIGALRESGLFAD